MRHTKPSSQMPTAHHWTLPGEPTHHLIVVGVIQILVVVICSLAFLHLVPHGPLARRSMAVIHGVICIPGRPNV